MNKKNTFEITFSMYFCRAIKIIMSNMRSLWYPLIGTVYGSEWKFLWLQACPHLDIFSKSMGKLLKIQLPDFKPILTIKILYLRSLSPPFGTQIG